MHTLQISCATTHFLLPRAMPFSLRNNTQPIQLTVDTTATSSIVSASWANPLFLSLRWPDKMMVILPQIPSARFFVPLFWLATTLQLYTHTGQLMSNECCKPIFIPFPSFNIYTFLLMWSEMIRVASTVVYPTGRLPPPGPLLS